MKTYELKGVKRTELSKKATAALRENGAIPCVIYGGKENIHFSVTENDVKNLIYTPNVYLVKLDIEGTQATAVMKDLQFHPVTDKTLHIDFVEVLDGKPVTIDIPVKPVGNSAGVLSGGKLRLSQRYLTVQGMAENLPDTLEVDITELAIGENLQVKDLSFDNITILNNASTLVVAVITTRAAKAAAANTTDAPAEAEEAAAE